MCHSISAEHCSSQAYERAFVKKLSQNGALIVANSAGVHVRSALIVANSASVPVSTALIVANSASVPVSTADCG